MKTINQYIQEQSERGCSLGKIHSLFDAYFDNFDINKIPLLERKKAIKDYEEIHNEYRQISEEFFIETDNADLKLLSHDIVSTQRAINILQEKYGMSDYQFMAAHPYNVQVVTVSQIPNYLVTTNSVLLPLVKKNVDIIKSEMDNIGYYMVRESKYHDMKTGIDWVLLMFDPREQDDITTQIKNNCEYLYHFTIALNKSSIKEHGIIPRNDKRVYTYKEKRVYLLTVGPTHPDFKKMLVNTSSNRKRHDKNFDGKFIIYTIKISKLPKNIKFFYDPHGQNCIFTTEVIPYSAILDEEEKTINV